MCVLMIDFNAYFASVEQQLRPELRGKPVAVVPVEADTTCCIAASYEARRWGIKTGTLVAEARRLCPQLKVVLARPEIYVRVHERIVEVVEQCIHIEEISSIDEMWGYVKARDEEEGRSLCMKIKGSIARNVGAYLKCSVGIGPNVFLAKVATDLEKPDGYVYLRREDVPRRILHLSLSDLCGIGKRMEARLASAGIKTIEELYNASRQKLRKIWGGIEGERFYEMLRGEPIQRQRRRTRTIGHSHVLPPAARHFDGAYAVGHRLLQKAAMRLRHQRLTCGRLVVWIRWTDRTRCCIEMGVGGTQDTMRLLAAYDEVWRELRREILENKKIDSFNSKPCFLSVGVIFTDLEAENVATEPLFEADRKRERLCEVVDALNRHYGRGKILWGGAILARDAAPMRIAFSRVPDVDLEGDWTVGEP
ncbi:MAG: hypothetical protein NZM04_02895 [Methylacidiphilales bacterium]|nr:hypothetical protein [Candidatus Methylacidiphilales bacterium]